MSYRFFFFFFNDTATTEIYTLSLHDALPICRHVSGRTLAAEEPGEGDARAQGPAPRARAAGAAGGDCRRPAESGGDRRAERTDPHLQLPPDARHRPPDRPDAPPPSLRPGGRPRRADRRADRSGAGGAAHAGGELMRAAPGAPTRRAELAAAVDRLSAAGIPSARVDAEWLLAAVLGVGRVEARLDLDRALPVPGPAAAVARESARQPGLAEHVPVVVGAPSARLGGGGADLLVSNPPYLPSAILSGLEPEVGAHEPRLALDGGGDGLRVIRRIVTSAREVLRPSAPLLLETAGGSQAGAVAGLLRAAGFTGVGVRADLAGVDRFVAGRA